jgi:hypothetical protein
MAKQALKAAFVLENRDLPRTQIIALGAKRGIPLSGGYVGKVLRKHPAPKVRRAAAQPQPAAVQRTAAPAAAPVVQRPAPAAPPPTSVSDMREEFLRLVFRIGADRVQEWIASIKP